MKRTIISIIGVLVLLTMSLAVIPVATAAPLLDGDDVDFCWNYFSGSSYSNETTDANDSDANDVWLGFYTMNACLYIGMDSQFSGVYVNVGTNGGNGEVEWEYWNGSWSSLEGLTTGFSDGSGDFMAGTGIKTVTFATTMPGDWVKNSVNGQNYFWVRARTIDTYSPAPNGTQISAITAPSGIPVTISPAFSQEDPTDSTPINFAVEFDEAVTGFGDSPSDVTLGGTANPTTAVVSGSGTTYNVAVSGMTTGGTVTASIPAGAANGVTGAPNAASNSAEVDYILHNPDLSDTCGLDMVLVLDMSLSIENADAVGDVKDAADDFVDAFLPATPSLIAIVGFNTTAWTACGLTDDVDDLHDAIDGLSASGYTNWEDALEEATDILTNPPDRNDAAHADLIVIFTDGDPTAYGDGTTDMGGTTALAHAIVAAEAAKTSTGPIRIVAVGIVQGATSENLMAISGSTVSPPATIDENTDVVLSSFGDLADALADIASALCGGTITIHKVIDLDGDINTDDPADRITSGAPVENWRYDLSGGSVNPTFDLTDNTGTTVAFDLSGDPAIVTITETLKTDYAFVGIIVSGGSGYNGSINYTTYSLEGLEVYSNDIVSVTFYNTPDCGPCETYNEQTGECEDDPSKDPTADFDADRTSGCPTLTVNFTDTSTNPYGTLSWDWDFDDGWTSTEQSPTHDFTSAGTYTVTLTVTNDCGSDTKTMDIIVTDCAECYHCVNGVCVDDPSQDPVAGFNVDYQSGCAPLTVNFDSSSSTGAGLSYSWDFGDGVGTSTDPSPSYTYDTPDTYTVELTVTNNCDSNSTTMDITVEDCSCPDCYESASQTIVSNDLGETTYVIYSENFSTPYIAILAWEPNSGTDPSYWDNQINYNFNISGADWIWEDYRVYDYVGGDVVIFENTVTIPDGAINITGTMHITCDNGYEVWLDGTTFIGSAQVHDGTVDWQDSDLTEPYVNTAGWQNVESYDVSAPVLHTGANVFTFECANEQMDGGTVANNPAGLIFEIQINYCIPNSPIATASNDGPVCEGDAVQLTGGATDGTPPYDYSWSGPGGFTSDQQNPTVDPAVAGTYTLTVTDDADCEGTATTDVTVNPLPDCTITAPDAVCENSNGLTASVTPITGATYAWTLTGDYSNLSGETTDAITFDVGAAGTVNVLVEITTAEGCYCTSNVDVTVNDSPVADAGLDQVIAPTTSILIGGSPTGSGGTPGYTYSWTPDDGSLDDATLANPIASPAATTTYTVTVTDSNGCTDTDYMIVTVMTTPAGGGAPGPDRCYLIVDMLGYRTLVEIGCCTNTTVEECEAYDESLVHLLELEDETLVQCGDCDGCNCYPKIIVMSLSDETIDPPDGMTLVGPLYDFTGYKDIRQEMPCSMATYFDPMATVLLNYDPELLPPGASEPVIGFFSHADNRWVLLPPDTGRIAEIGTATGVTGVFASPCAVLASAPTQEATPEPPPANPSPAHFVASGLSITPAEVNAGEAVTISLNVANDGEESGAYTAELLINGSAIDSKVVTLNGGQSQAVSFAVSASEAGTYDASVSGLNGSFTVVKSSMWWIYLVIAAVVIILGLLALRFRRGKAK